MNWKKSTSSGTQTACVELAWTGLVRDSKNPVGPVLRADLGSLVSVVKTGAFDR